jgi:hypothetical protein
MAKSDRGASLVDYALLVAILAVGLIGSTQAFTVELSRLMCRTDFQAFKFDEGMDFRFNPGRTRGWFCTHMDSEGRQVQDFSVYW